MASARDWVVVLFGLFIRRNSGWVSIAQLIELLEPLGADAASTRTAVSRLKRDGLIEACGRDGIAGYLLTADGEGFFADGDQRVLERSESDGRWVLASFSVPESKRAIRYKIRARLIELGFGQLSSGLLIAPAGLSSEAERTLRRNGLEQWVALWNAEFGALGDIGDVISNSWDIDDLRERYKSFISEAGAALNRGVTSESVAYQSYLHLVNEWRELAYLDPGLMSAVMGADWPQPQARELFDEVVIELGAAAEQFFRSVSGESRTHIPPQTTGVSA